MINTNVTTNVLFRTFNIQWNNSTGTAFTIDRNSKQYIVTARHVVSGITSGSSIRIRHDKRWKDLRVDVVGIGQGEVDVAVLTCSLRLSPGVPLVPSLANVAVGQSVSFLGYPFGWGGGGEKLNDKFPFPFVKSGVVSFLELGGEVSRIYLDAHGNQGFSGGPVVFVPLGERPSDELRVGGIVSYYPTPQLQPIVDGKGEPFRDSAGNPVAYVSENPGIVVAFHIRHALELIDANPIGLPLPDDD